MSAFTIAIIPKAGPPIKPHISSNPPKYDSEPENIITHDKIVVIIAIQRKNLAMFLFSFNLFAYLCCCSSSCCFILFSSSLSFLSFLSSSLFFSNGFSSSVAVSHLSQIDSGLSKSLIM